MLYVFQSDSNLIILLANNKSNTIEYKNTRVILWVFSYICTVHLLLFYIMTIKYKIISQSMIIREINVRLLIIKKKKKNQIKNLWL
jgi:hypothetical protein